MKNIFALLFCSVVLSACATKFYIPGNRFLSPESSGGFGHGDFKTGAIGVTDVQVASDMTVTSPDLTPKMNKNSSLSAGGQFGLFEKFDLYLTGVMGGPNFVGVKYQLLGDPAAAAKAENLSLSLAGGAAFSNSLVKSSSGDVQSESKINFSGWEALLLLGYRPMDSILLYAGPFQTVVNADVAIKRTQSNVTTVTAEPDGSGEMRGLIGGVRFGQNFFFSAELSATETTWTRQQPTRYVTDKFTDTALGAVIGGTW